MNVLFIEPFYSGSHKFFADNLKKYSTHDITLLTHEGKFWKWRMYGAAVTLANQFLTLTSDYDAIMVTDMLDLPLFLSLIRKKLKPDTPIYIYFHENQIAYPWKPDSEDVTLKRDLHYGMINYHSALAADKVLFNSSYNKETFLNGLQKILKSMPDYKHTDVLESLRHKSTVLPLGLELDAIFDPSVEDISDDKKPPLILWNHRWEHDKNPTDFYEGLCHLRANNIPFRLVMVGEQYKQMPPVFTTIKNEFDEELIHYGYADYSLYLSLLNQADILPVTSIHDFFGISVMEAIHCGATPLLPKRLSYVELYDPINNPEIFYETLDEMKRKLVLLCDSKLQRKHYRALTEPYTWDRMIAFYDKILSGHTDNT